MAESGVQGLRFEPGSAEVRALALSEFAPTLGRLVALRFVAALLLGLFAVVFAVVGPTSWRTWVLGISAVVLGITAAYDLRRTSSRPFTLAWQTYLLLGVFAIHSVIIATTGGIQSPFIVLYLVLCTIGAMSLGSARHTAALVLPAIAMIWVMTVFDVFAPGSGEVLPRLMAARGTGPGYRWFFASVLTLATFIGSAVGYVHRVALDRAIWRAAVVRREALAGMEARNRELTELSGALAHELKNPLASIQGLAGLLVRKLPEGSREAEQMGVLLSEARRMGGILDEFLNFSRPVGGLAVRSVLPEALLADVLVLHEGWAAGRGIGLAVEGGGAPAIRCDPRKVKQVLVNLVQNALEAVPRGGRVWLRTRVEGEGRVRFEVEDDGAGLAPEVRERLFRPGTTTKPNGTGLGLTVARTIARQHGGTLVLEDREGGGCRAVLELPVSAAGEEGGPS